MEANPICGFFGCTIEHDHIFRGGKDVAAYGATSVGQMLIEALEAEREERL